MTFVKRLDKHPAYCSADVPEQSTVKCPDCGGQLNHYVNEELTPEKKRRDGFSCENSIFHNLGKNDPIVPRDVDLTCCTLMEGHRDRE